MVSLAGQLLKFSQRSDLGVEPLTLLKTFKGKFTEQKRILASQYENLNRYLLGLLGHPILLFN